MNITTENIEEWCFRYLEKDLNTSECAFFEKELQTNVALQKEYALWKKTKLTDFSSTISPNLNKRLYRFSTQLLWMIIEFSFVTSLVVFMIHTLSPAKPAVSKTRAATILQPIQTSNTKTLSKYTSSKEILILKDVKINPEEIIISNAETSVIDSISNNHTISNNQDSASVSIKNIKLDTIQSLKDSTSEKKVKPANKTQKRKYQNGSRLIPINNDL